MPEQQSSDQALTPVQKAHFKHFEELFQQDENIQLSLNGLELLQPEEIDLVISLARKAEILWGAVTINKEMMCCLLLKPYIDDYPLSLLEEMEFSEDIIEIAKELNETALTFEKDEMADLSNSREETKNIVQLTNSYAIKVFNYNFRENKTIDWTAADMMYRYMAAFGPNENPGLREMMNEALDDIVEMSEHKDSSQYKIIAFGM